MSAQTILMYCHQPKCPKFDQEVARVWLGATWESPPEWHQDPECGSCGNELHEDRWDFDVALVERLADLNLEPRGAFDLRAGGVMGAAAHKLAQDITTALDDYEKTRAWDRARTAKVRQP